jgi:hypothetical protein
MTDPRVTILTMGGVLLAAALLAGAIDAPVSEPVDPVDHLQSALADLHAGNLRRAELQASVLATDPEDGTSRAWLVVAAARQRRGKYVSAARAYQLYLSQCDSASLRDYVRKQIETCSSLAKPATPMTAPSAALTAADRKALAAVDDKRHVESSEHFVVQAPNAKLARLIARQAEKDLARICAEILPGQEYAHSVDINVWVDHNEFVKNAQDAPEWSGGGFAIEIEDGSITRRIDLTQQDENGNFADVMLDRVLPHEMCHLVTHEYFGDAGSPLFLNEGLAMLAEHRVSNERVLLAGLAIGSRKHLSLQDLLTTKTNSILEKPALFYAESFSLAEYLHSRLTRDQFRKMLHHIKNGCTTADAIQRALYVAPSEEFIERLEKSWEEHAIAQAQLIEALAASAE